MKRVVVDTNVIASFLTDRNPAQQARAAALLAAAERRELELVVPQLVVAELAFVLQNLYGRSPAETAATLHDLLALPGVVTEDRLPWARLFALWPAVIADFADAALAAVCLERRDDAVATFDLAFRRRLGRLGLASFW